MYRPGQVPPQMTGYVPPQATGMPVYQQPQMPQRFGPQLGVPVANRPMLAPQATGMGMPGMGMGMGAGMGMGMGMGMPPQATGMMPQPTGMMGPIMGQPTGMMGPGMMPQPTGMMPQPTGMMSQPTGLMPMATGMGMGVSAAIADPRLRLMSSQFLPGPAMAGAGPGGVGGLGVGWNPAAQQPAAFQNQFSQYAPLAPVTNLAPAPSAPRQAGLRWTLTPEERASYDRIFKAWDRNKTGYLDGGVAREVLGQSGLPDDVLMRIWHLADQDNRGKLNRSEFHIAMGLIYRALNGVPPPDALPQELRTQSQRDLDDSVDFMRDLLKRNNQKSNPQRGTPLAPKKATVTSLADATMDTVKEAPETEEDPLADLNAMKAALEQSRKTLAESEAVPEVQEDTQLKQEMDTLRHDIRRVQQDIEYFARRGGNSDQAREARRRAERELLTLTTERLPALERRMQQRDNPSTAAKDTSREAAWKGSFERQPERSTSASTISPSRTPVPPAPAPAAPAPALAHSLAPNTSAAQPSGPRQQQSNQPPQHLDAAGRAAWLKEQAQKRVQDRMRALGLLAPVSEGEGSGHTGAEEGLATRMEQDAEEDARRAKEAEERAAARSARWDESQRSREAEKKARWERLAQMEREEKEAAAKQASPKPHKAKASPSAPSPAPAPVSAHVSAPPPPQSAAALPAPQRRMPGRKAAPPPPPKRHAAPSQASTSVNVAPPAPAASSNPVHVSPPPSASSLAPSEASAVPPPPVALPPATHGDTNPFFRTQAAPAVAPPAPPAPAPAPAPQSPTKSTTNPFYRSNLPPPQRATPPAASSAPASAPAATAAVAAAAAMPLAPRAPVDDDDDWGDHSEAEDDEDGEGAGALGTRAGRANLAQALFGGLVPQREATPPAAPAVPGAPAPPAPPAPAPPAPSAPSTAPATPAAPAFKPSGGPVNRNALLQQIQGGARLKHATTKDRSGPLGTGKVLGSASPPPQPQVETARAADPDSESLAPGNVPPPPPPAAAGPGAVENNPYRQSVAWQSTLAADSFATPGAFPEEPDIEPVGAAAGSDDGFVVVPAEVNADALATLQATLQGQQRALYSYAAGREEDLALTEGDVVTLTPSPEGEGDDGWSYGVRADGAVGWFPSAYVGPIGSTRVAQALYAYTPAPAVDPAEADAEAELEEGMTLIALQGEDGAEWIDVLDPRMPPANPFTHVSSSGTSGTFKGFYDR